MFWLTDGGGGGAFPYNTVKGPGKRCRFFFSSVFLYSLPGAVQPQSLNKVRCIVYAHNLKSVERFLEGVYLQQQMALWGRKQGDRTPHRLPFYFPKVEAL